MKRGRTVVLRALGLGDLLAAVPALRAIRRARPEDAILLATPAVLEPLALRSGAVDAVVDTAPLAPLDERLHRADLAVNLHGRGPESTGLLRAAGPSRLVAFGEEIPWRAGEHERRRWCRLVSTALGADAHPDDVRLGAAGLPPSPAPDALVLHPGAASGARRWPPERFAAVARRWREARGEVVVTGGPDEVDLARRVATLADLPDDAVLAGRTDLETLAALVAAAQAVVCGDTGVAHLASAFATPSVVLFGPTPPDEWGPPAGGPHLALHRGGRGDPHGAAPDPALLRIAVDEVLDALRRVDRAHDG